MKELKTSREIAEALNFGKYPVFTLDLDSRVPGWENEENFKYGSRCRLEYNARNHGKMLIGCTLTLSDGRFTLSPDTTCLKKVYTINDHLRDAETAMSPIVHATEEVAIYCYSKKYNVEYVRVMRIGDRVDPFCISAAKLIDLD